METTFLSFIVLPARNSFPLCRKLFETHASATFPVKPNPSTHCKRQRSSDSSTFDFASSSPESKDIEVEFPVSSP